MYRILMIREERTEYAKAVRRRTGTNGYRYKRLRLLRGDAMQCVGTTLTSDNLIAVCYE